MATYYRGRPLADTKFIVHPHYATQQEASDEAIGHQVRHNIDYTHSIHLRVETFSSRFVKNLRYKTFRRFENNSFVVHGCDQFLISQRQHKLTGGGWQD